MVQGAAMEGRPIPDGLLRLAVLLVALALTISTSRAIEDVYFGTWSKIAGKCDPDEVIQITKEGVSGNEYACKTTRSSRDKNGWNLRMSCDGEGYNWTLNLRWRLLKSGRLRETAKGKTVEYTRCTAVAGPQSQSTMDTPFGRLTPREFTLKCVECFNDAQQMNRSVGGYCPPDCVPVFSEQMICDNQGRCRAGP